MGYVVAMQFFALHANAEKGLPMMVYSKILNNH